MATGVAPARSICGRCGDIVYLAGSRTLTAVRVAGGLFDLDGQGRLHRRRTADMAVEYASRRRERGGGYDLHECPDTEHWAVR
jgi:hypothetical protein